MTKSKSLHAEASLHRKLVLFAVQLEGYLAHFPNCHKYTLTQALRQAFIDVYNLTTEAQKRYHKKTTLQDLDAELDLLRSQVRMAKNMGYIDFKKYEHWSRLNDEIGRMVGGWVKAFAGDGNGGAR